MKKTSFAGIFFVALAALAAPRPVEASVSVGVSLSYFHETLAPHGRWVMTASYGEAWVPSVVTGWAPYVNGEWAYTDCGWTWISYDPWGSIPFHYGTWVWVDWHGWAWVPGRVWAPAWVTWAITDDYIGWAPVPPEFFLSRSGYEGRPIALAPARYVFVPARQFVGVRVATVRVSSRRNPAIFERSSRVTTFAVSRDIVRNVGPSPGRIERAGGRRIQRVPIEETRVQPATLADTGMARAATLSTVASQRERARAHLEVATARAERLAAPKAHPAPKRAVQKKAGSPAPKIQKSKAPKREPKIAPTGAKAGKKPPAARSGAPKQTHKEAARKQRVKVKKPVTGGVS